MGTVETTVGLGWSLTLCCQIPAWDSHPASFCSWEIHCSYDCLISLKNSSKFPFFLFRQKEFHTGESQEEALEQTRLNSTRACVLPCGLWAISSPLWAQKHRRLTRTPGNSTVLGSCPWVRSQS